MFMMTPKDMWHCLREQHLSFRNENMNDKEKTLGN